jgi:hypothetical protein
VYLIRELGDRHVGLEAATGQMVDAIVARMGADDAFLHSLQRAHRLSDNDNNR